MTPAAAPLSHWKSIVQRALLGTGRTAAQATAPAEGELAAYLAGVGSLDAETALLASAALAGAYEVAGRLPGRARASTVASAIPESEDLPPAPPHIVRYLVAMLGGLHPYVLHEWVGGVSARGWRVPTAMLPAVLEAARREMAVRDIIAPVLGARGRWLAIQNHEWSEAVGYQLPGEADLPAAWESGTPEERLGILVALRGRDPARARALVESTWSDEGASRWRLLDGLRTNLGPDDEPFLEQRLDDRLAEVRRTAHKLLRLLPHTRLGARMTERAQGALQWKPARLVGKGQIIVEPPAELDAGMLRDGVEKKPPHGIGERGWWLAQIVAATPPSTWSERWHVAPATLIAIAAKGEWATVLIDGWATAAVRYRDAAWIEALLASAYPNERALPFAPTLERLIMALPVEPREAFIARSLRADPEAARVADYVAAADHSWSEEFARAVLDWARPRLLRPAVAGARGINQHLLRARLIPRMALGIPPTLASATEGWPTSGTYEDAARDLEQFVAPFTFRRELHEELERCP